MPGGAYSLADLCGLADVTPRTVRYYIAQGLLRSPGTTGPGARYDDGHLARLRLVRHLQREHLPLAEIRARLAALTDDEAIAQAEGPAEPPADSALDYVRGVLERPAYRASRRQASESAMLSATDARQPAPRADWPATLAAGAPDLREAPASSMVGAPLEPPSPLGPEAKAAPEAQPAPDRSHWERYTLAPDVELHVRRPLTRSQNRAVVRLVETGRQLLEEEQP
ncbi:MAG: MerR family transcriptional regulator [Chloroflexota bacterium]